MSSRRDYRLATVLVSLLAGLTTWVTLLAWHGFAERPAGFLVPILGGCLLVAAVGVLLRSARAPALVVASVQVVMVLLWLHHRLGAPEALGGWIPTPASVRAAAEAVAGSAVAAQEYAAPVPESVHEFYPLLILAGVATAVLVDFLAVGIRRAPLAGLPLLAVYTAPASILDGGVGWLIFVAAALCFLFLIAAVDGSRLTGWGRRLTPGPGLFESSGASPGSGGVWSSARKIGFTATALAVVVPLLLPTFTGTLFGGGQGGGDGSGPAVSISNPMVDLKRDLTRGADVDLVSVRTREPDPSYLRITVLDSFDGSAWRPADRDIPIEQRAAGLVPRPAGLEAGVPTKEFPATIDVSDDFKSRWLPTPYPVSSVEARGDWRYDRSTLDFISAADDETTAGLSYRVRALVVTPTAEQLASAVYTPLAVSRPNTALPDGFPKMVRDLARSVTAGQQSKFEKAVALQQWFRVGGGFRYSLARTPGNGTDDLVSFLSTGKNGRTGYCEQFAAAMAVMGRSLGIPSRVAVGFLRPEAKGNSWVFSAHDLHSWPEMYFGGVGWVRFEPTPQARTGSVPSYTTQPVPQAAPSSSTSTTPSAAPAAGRIDRSPDQQSATGNGTTGSSLERTLWPAALVVVLALVLLLIPRVLRTLVRRRRWAAATDPRAWAEAGWQEVRDTARDLGLEWNDQLTLRTTARGLERCFGDPAKNADDSAVRPRRGPDVNPQAAQALHRLVRLLERARYASTLPAGATTAQLVADDVSACMAAMRAGAGRRRAARALWLPGSVLSSPTTRRRRSARSERRLAGPGIDRAV